jgi:hypothetical protein
MRAAQKNTHEMGSEAQPVFISRGLFVLFGSAEKETDFASVLASVGVPRPVGRGNRSKIKDGPVLSSFSCLKV